MTKSISGSGHQALPNRPRPGEWPPELRLHKSTQLRRLTKHAPLCADLGARTGLVASSAPRATAERPYPRIARLVALAPQMLGAATDAGLASPRVRTAPALLRIGGGMAQIGLAVHSGQLSVVVDEVFDELVALF